MRLTATTNLQHYSGGHDVGVPAESNNAGMLAVGAARHDNTNDVRGSSNRGPTVLPYPAGRTKPDIVGATCVATATDPPEFCGTSGAAPHVAGLAALVRDRYPTYTPAQVANYLKTNALVRGGSVPNHEWGNGFAYLPSRGTISPAPSTVAENTFTALTVNTNVPSPGIGISLNETTDTGNLSLSSTCLGSTNLAARRIDGDALIIRGCRAGTATVKVYDPATGNFLQTYTVNVTATPTAAPTTLGTAITKTLYTGDTETIDIARKFGGSVASYTVSSSDTLKAIASITGSSLTINALAASTTTVTVTVTATNSLGSATQQYFLTIATPVSPSAVSTIPTQSINTGDTTTINLSGYFAGNVDSYSASSSDVTKATAVMNGPILTVTGIAAGTPTITATATNNTNAIGTANQTFTVTVTSLVPMASGTPGNQSVTAGAGTTVGVSGYFTGDVDSYSASSWNTAVATASMSGSNLTITGVAAGSTTIRVTATNTTNAIGTATQDYPVTVTATTTTPTAGGPTVPTGGPSVNAGSDKTVSTGATVSLFGTGSPVNDDDDATYNWTQQSGTTVSLKNAVTPSLPYTSGLGGNAAKFTAPSTAGALVFRLTVTDHGTGLSSWDELAVTVN